MNIYKNISYSAKTFYGVKFAPGEVKQVSGYINDPNMIRVFGITPIPEKKTSITEPRSRKKKPIEPEKDSFAETTENKIISEEETSNGNPS